MPQISSLCVTLMTPAPTQTDLNSQWFISLHLPCGVTAALLHHHPADQLLWMALSPCLLPSVQG